VESGYRREKGGGGNTIRGTGKGEGKVSRVKMERSRRRNKTELRRIVEEQTSHFNKEPPEIQPEKATEK